MLFDTPPAGSAAFRGLVVAFGISAVGFGSIEPFLVICAHRDAGLAGLLFVAQAAAELCGRLADGLIADRFAIVWALARRYTSIGGERPGALLGAVIEVLRRRIRRCRGRRDRPLEEASVLPVDARLLLALAHSLPLN